MMTIDNDADKFSLVTIKKCSIYNLEKYFLKNHVIFFSFNLQKPKMKGIFKYFCLPMNGK